MSFTNFHAKYIAHELTKRPPGFTEGYVEVNGVTIHYVKGGSGEPLVLIHGWPQTWYAWRGVMPRLAALHTVVAVDLRGIGGSSKPPASAGYDARTLAVDVRGVMRHLGFDRVSVVGHDIGLLVAHAYAVTYPKEVKLLVILEGLLVGIEPMWTEFARNPLSWNFGFNETPELPEKLTAGRERILLRWFFDNISVRPEAITKEAEDEYVRTYSEPGAMSASFEWYRAFPKDIEFILASARNKLRMPVLALGAEKTMGRFMVPMVQTVAEDVRGGVIPDCGHYVPEEKPDYLVQQLNAFLA